MPTPENLFDLLDNNNEFPFAGWQMDFANYPYFYVLGVRETMAKAGIYDKSIVCSEMSNALSNVPQSWKNEYPAGEWDRIDKNQIKRVISAKLVRYDKACISLKAIEQSLINNGKSNVDLYNYIRIKPALFQVRGFTKGIVNGLINLDKLNKDYNIFDDIVLVSKQNGRAVFYEMGKGHTVTHETAMATADFLKLKGVRNADGVPIDTAEIIRNRAGYKKPAPSERVIY